MLVPLKQVPVAYRHVGCFHSLVLPRAPALHFKTCVVLGRKVLGEQAHTTRLA